MNFLDRRRASRDQCGIDLVVLRPLQQKPRIGTHLCGLKHHDHKPIASQMGNDILLITTARLDADPADPMALEPSR